MVVNRKRGLERMEKTTDGKEVKKEGKLAPLVLQAKVPKKNVGNYE
jgi:hypothetical protein